MKDERTTNARADRIGELLKLAGRRRRPDAMQMARARAAAHDEWRQFVAERNRRAWWWAWTGTAMAACAAGLLAWSTWSAWSWLHRPAVPSSHASTELATLQRVTGSVRVTSANGESRVLSDADTGMRVRVGDRIETIGPIGVASEPTTDTSATDARATDASAARGTTKHGTAGSDRAAHHAADPGRVAFTLADGLSVRLDRDTIAVLERADRLRLERGAAYVDSGSDARRAARAETSRSPSRVSRQVGLEVETPFGRVRHLGTQFEVRLQQQSLRVRVREGEVAVLAVEPVEHAEIRWTAQAGEALVVARGRAPERQAIATFGPEWTWVSDLAQTFRLEGATVATFLDWVTREQGWHWQIDDPAMRARIERIVLHGSIEGLTPEEALAAVLPTCGLTYRRDGDRLAIGTDVAR